MCASMLFWCFVIIAFLFFAQESLAASKQVGNPDYILTDMIKLVKGKTDEILGYGRTLFMGLSLLSLSVSLVRHIMSGESNLGSVFVLLAKWILFTSFFLFLMGGARTGGQFLPTVITDSFMKLGETITGATASPAGVLTAGVKLCGDLYDTARSHGWIATITAGISCVGIMIMFGMLAAFIATASLEMYIAICSGAVLMGFAGLENTRDIAMGYIKYAVSVGVKLLTIMLIASLAQTTVTEWGEQLAAANVSAGEFFRKLSFLSGGVSTLMLAAYQVPGIAQAAVSGSSVSAGLPGASKVAKSVGSAVGGAVGGASLGLTKLAARKAGGALGQTSLGKAIGETKGGAMVAKTFNKMVAPKPKKDDGNDKNDKTDHVTPPINRQS